MEKLDQKDLLGLEGMSVDALNLILDTAIIWCWLSLAFNSSIASADMVWCNLASASSGRRRWLG